MPTIQQFLLDMDELLEAAPGSTKADAALDDLEGWGSMAVLGLLATADEKYGISLKPGDIKDCATVAQLFEALGRSRA